jgi:hypothetical protein
MTKRAVRFLTLVSILLLFAGAVSAREAKAQGSGYMEFIATGADSCGLGGLHIYGYQLSSTGWMIEISPGIPYGIPGGFFIYTWQLSDSEGVIGYGGYNSSTGVVTGDGGNNSGFDFTASRAPVGSLSQMSFSAIGSLYAKGADGPCYEGYYVSTTNSVGGGGSWSYQ